MATTVPVQGGLDARGDWDSVSRVPSGIPGVLSGWENWVGRGNDDVWSMINEKCCCGLESQLSGWRGLRAYSWGGNVSGRQVGSELVRQGETW